MHIINKLRCAKKVALCSATIFTKRTPALNAQVNEQTVKSIGCVYACTHYNYYIEYIESHICYNNFGSNVCTV